jgi:hypothetical protein
MKLYNQFETLARALEDSIKLLDIAADNGIGLEEFKAGLATTYERDCFDKVKEHCARFVELYDEMDTIA